MSKTKWHTRAIYLVVALVMTLGLVLVPAAPPQDSEVAASPDTTFRLSAASTAGTACWEIAAPAPYAGTYSVELDHLVPAGSVHLEFVPAPGTTVADLATIGDTNYWYYTADDTWLYLELRFTDPCSEGFVDVTHQFIVDQVGEKNAWLNVDVDASSDFFFNGETRGGVWFQDITMPKPLAGILAGINAAMQLADAQPAVVNAADWELTRVRSQLWEGGARTCNIDDITIDGDLYAVERGPEYWMDPDIAYNVKTATETFTLMGPCGPVDVAGGSATRISWSVEKGCGVPGGGPVHYTGGTSKTTDAGVGDNYITVRLNTKGDCHVCAVYDPDGDGSEPAIEVCAEKKWGDIYCTELTKGALVDDECCVTEYVEASFLWDDCVAEEELPADGAVVDWWLMDIHAQAAVQALEAILGVDPCDDDGGCGTYTPDFFSYDIDGDLTIQADEVFDSPREAMLAIYGLTANEVVNTESYINFSTNTHETTSSDENGETAVTVHIESPTSVILVTLTDYPIDKNGQNTVCVQHETWIIIPPPVIEKLPNILWAGEKDVIEWRLGADAIGSEVAFYLEDPSVGTFESMVPAPANPPWPGFAIKDTAWDVVSANPCDPTAGVARVVLHSDKQGKSNVIAQLLTNLGTVEHPVWEITTQQGFIIYFLAFEDVELKNIEENPTNDEAWESEGDELSDLYLDNSSKLRLRVKGWFEDPVMTSPRAAKPQDLDDDGTTDIILPAGRWVFPDDYPFLATGKLMWDMMDTPVDDIVSWLDDDGDQVETLGFDDTTVTPLPAGVGPEVGAYGDGACFEAPLFDATLTTAQKWAAYIAKVKAFGPVIGPFSKLEPVNADGTGWDILKQPGVRADTNLIDAWLFTSGGCRTTVVPDGLITVEDANMPPAEILFAITAGSGLLADVNKADLYQISETCDTDTGVVYTNPYYWQEIPANPIIPPMYGSALAGYEWDSWGWGTDTTIDGPYRFWDERTVWTADELILMNILDLAAVPTTALKAYTDNHGEAWVEFTQKSFDSSTIKAVATYPYLIGDHLPLVSNPVVKISEDFKEVKVAWERIDDMYDMLYVFVRDYDGDPAVCEPVDWNIDGIAGTIISLLTDTAGPCDNACLDITCTGSIADGSRSAESCTRAMTTGTTGEIAKFTGATISLPLDRFHRELGEPGELLFDPDATIPELPVDYAIAGIKVSSSLGDDVDIIIKIHDCWEDVGEVVIDEDQILYFGNVVPPEEDILDYYRGLDGIVSTSELLTAIGDWASETIPSGFTAALTTAQLLTLISDWAS